MKKYIWSFESLDAVAEVEKELKARHRPGIRIIDLSVPGDYALGIVFLGDSDLSPYDRALLVKGTNKSDPGLFPEINKFFENTLQAQEWYRILIEKS